MSVQPLASPALSTTGDDRDCGICAVVGAQFGSEAKGHVVGHIANLYRLHVRVGAANAGHTVYTHRLGGSFDQEHNLTYSTLEPEKHVMQQLPCAAYAAPSADLAIGPGALISPRILDAELKALTTWRQQQGMSDLPFIFVDGRAHVIHPEQISREQKTDLAARIGSTSTIAKEGIGVAQADRAMRDSGCVLAKDYFVGDTRVILADVPHTIDHTYQNGWPVLLEGTQGAGLSLTTGNFPYVTSRNSTAAGLCADAGVAPTRLNRVILVARTYPIRVAGNSGPFWYDSKEISWESLGIDPGSERTTVTKKVRRVATFSCAQVAEAAMLNGATEIALMFTDYLEPEFAGNQGRARIGREFSPRDHPKLTRMIEALEKTCGIPVTMLGTGPYTMVDLDPDEA